MADPTSFVPQEVAAGGATALTGPGSLAELRAWIAADLDRYDRGRLGTLAREPQTRWQVRLRVTEYVAARHGGAVAAFARWRLQAASIRFGFTIPPGVAGPGLKLPHWGTIVVSSRARVGAGVTIHPGVCLGIHAGRAPAIGDGVYLGPGAKVFGGVEVGEGSSVGANAVLTRSVAAGAVVYGPAATDHAVRS